VAVDADVKDVLLVAVPAGFTLGGTVIGSLLNQRAAGAERRKIEDAEARAAVVALSAPFADLKPVLRELRAEGPEVWTKRHARSYTAIASLRRNPNSENASALPSRRSRSRASHG
jgi:hypothetical protein